MANSNGSQSTLDAKLSRERRREERRFGFAVPIGAVAVFEFDRMDLEELLILYPTNDEFTSEVRKAMRWMDGTSDV